MADPPIYLEMFVSTLYEQRRRRQQYIVVYKGGHIEKDLLNKLNIPCVDLKEFGCPKANELLLIGGNVGFVYGHHLHALFSGGMLSILAMVNETLSGYTPFLNVVY